MAEVKRANGAGARRAVYSVRLVAALSVVAAILVMLARGNSEGLLLPIIAQSIVALVFARVVITAQGNTSIATFVLVLLELLRGCIVPLLVELIGQRSPQYRNLGTFEDGALVLWIGCGFFSVVMVTLWVIRLIPSKSHSPGVTRQEDHGELSNRGISIMIVLGMVGLVLRFPTTESIAVFVQSSMNANIPEGQSLGSIAGFFGSVLRPLLPLGLALLIVKRRSAGRPAGLIWLLLAVSVFFALGSYSLNRAAIILPIAAFLIAIVVTKTARIPPFAVGIIAVAVGGIFFWVGDIRRAMANMGGAPIGEGAPWVESAIQTLMIYGQSPLQSAPTLTWADREEWGSASFIRSLLSPIPGIADEVRLSNGTAIYNRAIYGRTDAIDQIFPSWLEAYLSFGVSGIVALGLILVAIALWIDAAVRRAQTLIEVYAASLAALVVAQLSISSVTAILQTLLYFVAVPTLIAWSMRRRWTSLSARRLTPGRVM